jgi:hypothetical protein
MPAFPGPETTVRAFFAEALALEGAIEKSLGTRWKPLFRAIRRQLAGLRFSDDDSEAAFYIDPVTDEFVFFTAGFYLLRSAMFEVFGSDIEPALIRTFLEVAYVSYALHEVFHPEQGLAEFSVVQDHKNIPSGFDEIGKMDHCADNAAISLTAAVQAARLGNLDRGSYLRRFRDVAYLVNRSAPLAFGVKDSALHKQKRRLVNWLCFERVDDGLRSGSIPELELAVGPLDAPMWMHFNIGTGDVVLWEQEPMHRVLGTARVRPGTLRRALAFREEMDRGELMAPIRALLRAMRIDSASIKIESHEQVSPTQAS